MIIFEKGGYELHITKDHRILGLDFDYCICHKGNVYHNGFTLYTGDGCYEEIIDNFIFNHHVASAEFGDIIKYVARHPFKKGRFVQIQALRRKDETKWVVQMFDDELLFITEYQINEQSKEDVAEYILLKYEIVKGLPVSVYRASGGDFSNNGISSTRSTLYIVDREELPFMPNDIRQCVRIQSREVAGHEYLYAETLANSKRWRMAGGNFIFSGDSRYKEIAGTSYPVSVHDRIEEEQENNCFDRR